MSLAATGPLPRGADAPTPSLAGYVERDAEAGGGNRLGLLVAGAHCGGCVRKIEDALAKDETVTRARVNLSTRRLDVAWNGPATHADRIVERLAAIGFDAVPYRASTLAEGDTKALRSLIKALAVAGFGTANVMMLSWAVWAGHFDTMGEATRAFFHWLSAAIALPTIAYAGRPFFNAAWSAVSRGRANMDVPISLGVIATTVMSLVETINGGPHVYFDGALALLFVLLIGRVLDQRVRGEARSAVHRLAALTTQPVMRLAEDGTAKAVPPESIEAGETVLVAAGERVGVDGVILSGRSTVDTSLIDGESIPKEAGPGTTILAGATNLSAPLSIKTRAAGQATSLAEIVRLLEAAEAQKGRFVSLVDHAVRWYTPIVHILAAATFAGWVIAGAGWQPALVAAVCVLIVTCPCALGLAAPMTRAAAASRLLRAGVLLKSDTVLERLSRIDTVVFDKTGTLTAPQPSLTSHDGTAEDLALAASLAASSRHPLAAAIYRAAPDVVPAKGVSEASGEGLVLERPDGPVRLGSAAFVGATTTPHAVDGPEVYLSVPGRAPVRFAFSSPLRPGAKETIDRLSADFMDVRLLSGDRPQIVGAMARAVGIHTWRGRLRPQDKIAEVEKLKEKGRSVLMVGDGLNDAPALAAADASLCPGSALDISRQAADAVWQGERMADVSLILKVARRAHAILIQNIAFSMLYNAAWIPIAMAGLVTPWIAAIAMSASSILVTLNAMRVGGLGATRGKAEAA